MVKKSVVLITGAGKGLGKAVVEKFLQEGYLVYGTYNQSKPVNKEGVMYLKIDVTSDLSVTKAISKIIKQQKRIDILINCSGISPSDATLNFTSEDFEKVLQVNVIGPFRMIKAVVPSMRKSGVVINITSLNGFLSLPHSGIYSASKFALEALGLALRQELAGSGIRVVNVAPGAFTKPEQKEKKLKHIPARDKFKVLKWLLPFATQEQVVDNVFEMVKKRKYPPRILVGVDAKIAYVMQKVLPIGWFDKIMMAVWQKRGSLAFRS